MKRQLKRALKCAIGTVSPRCLARKQRRTANFVSTIMTRQTQGRTPDRLREQRPKNAIAGTRSASKEPCLYAPQL